MDLSALNKGVRYFYLRFPGRSPLCVCSIDNTSIDQLEVVRYLARSGVLVDECSFEDMLNFPATHYSLFRIGALLVDVSHNIGLDFSKIFKQVVVRGYLLTDSFAAACERSK